MVIYFNNNVTNDIHDNTASVSTLLLAITARGVVEHTARTLNLEMESNLSEIQFPAHTGVRRCTFDSHTPHEWDCTHGGVEFEAINGTLKRLKSKIRKLDIVSPYKTQKLGIVSPSIYTRGRGGGCGPPPVGNSASPAGDKLARVSPCIS